MWPLVLEPVGVGQEGGVERGLADDAHAGGQAIVHALRGHVADAAVAVLMVVPGEEGLKMCIRDRCMDRPARLFLCARCRTQVLLCSHCDRGQRYCTPACSRQAREAAPVSYTHLDVYKRQRQISPADEFRRQLAR